MAHPNVELVRKGFEAFAAGDMATMAQIMADDARWHFPGTSPASGDFEGTEAIFASFARLGQEADSLQQEIHAILADDEHAVALVKTTAVRGDKTLQYDMVFVFHVAGGKMTEAWVTPVDRPAVDAFWTG
jgi:ketosteroid isomerase-like protein